MSISASGLILDSTLDGLGVEQAWLAGQYVYWETGDTMPTIPPVSEGYEKDTHCSAFAAAAALKLGVPLLHPNPPPKLVVEKHLANHQAEWLQGLPESWQSVSGPLEAQDLANQGYFVVIVYLNPNTLETGEPASGHIQVVRAFDLRTDNDIETDGPQIIQAGKINFNSTTASEGFASGYAASYPSYPWPDNVSYYAHPTYLPDED